jgi:hypothetical protein
MFSKSDLRDEVSLAMHRARAMESDLGMTGHGVVALWSPEDGVKALVPFTNLITTVGDEYYAKRAIAGINSYSFATTVTGMKYGTGTTAAAKSSTGSYLVTPVSTSYRSVWDSTTATAVGGTDTGWYTTYTVTWAAGTATTSAITEAALLTANTDASAAVVISRVVFTAVNKTASDALTITWNHKFLGAAA